MSQQTSPSPSDQFMTDAEREIHASFDAAGNPQPNTTTDVQPLSAPEPDNSGAATLPQGGAAPAAAVAAEPAAAETPAAADAAATAAAAAAAAAAAPPAPVQPDHGPVTQRIDAPAPRDFDAERRALRESYNNGTFEGDDDAYQDRLEALLTAKAEHSAIARTSEALAASAWEITSAEFFRRPENLTIANNPDLMSMFNGMLNAVATDAAHAGRTLSDWELHQEGRRRLADAVGWSRSEVPTQPAAVTATAPAAAPSRAPDLSGLPPGVGQTAGSAGGGGTTGGNAFASAIEADDLMRAEEIGARMSESEWDQLLRSTPGQFAD